MTRSEIIAGFHKLYLENIAKETANRGSVGARKGGGIPIEALKKIHDDTIADYVESFIEPPDDWVHPRVRKSALRKALDHLSPRKGITSCFAD
jgi:hypothetical protein